MINICAHGWNVFMHHWHHAERLSICAASHLNCVLISCRFIRNESNRKTWNQTHGYQDDHVRCMQVYSVLFSNKRPIQTNGNHLFLFFIVSYCLLGMFSSFSFKIIMNVHNFQNTTEERPHKNEERNWTLLSIHFDVEAISYHIHEWRWNLTSNFSE